mmetsp:Transcript_36469/g.97069  ORF Transcript_36469/g.97069 Transcript_36469/m.97069 type:complete len:432 (-) Transcript_36469:72-1367(-)
MAASSEDVKNEEAETFKVKGNQAFKDQNWDQAISHYNKAITLDPTNAAYYSNRAGAWSSKGNHNSALADAEKCLKLDPTFAKGYARKGKALFDLDRWKDAEAAYNDGLKRDPTNATMKKNISDVQAAAARRLAQSSSGGAVGGWMSKIMSSFKNSFGGQMKLQVMILGGFVLYSMYKRTPESVEPVELTRRFTEVDGHWYSSLQQGRGEMLLFLHRTSSTASTEFGTFIPRLPRAHAVVPDRPCHGYTPCNDEANWLVNFARSIPSKRITVIASGREAVLQAFDLANSRTEVAQLMLLSSGTLAPSRESLATGDVKALLDTRPDTSQVADFVSWAAQSGAEHVSEGLSSVKVPDCSIKLLFNHDEEDEELRSVLDNAGVTFDTRTASSEETVLDVLLDEIGQALAGPETSGPEHSVDSSPELDEPEPVDDE